MSLKQPLSEVDICNLAMVHLKEQLVVQIDPASTNAEKLCRQVYQQIRRATLRSHPWNFASRRIVIAQDSKIPPFGFSHAFNLPDGFIRFKSRLSELDFQDFPPIQGFDYEIENGQILLNTEDGAILNLKFVFDEKEISKFDPLFIDLFAVNLAIHLAPNFTNKGAGTLRTLLDMRREIKSEAKAIDGQERPPRRIQRSRWNNARRGFSRAADGRDRFS